MTLLTLGMILAVVLVAPVSAQSVTEWSTEKRTVLSFKVNDAAAQRLLPAGWTVAPSTAAANAGANLNVTLIERELVLDGQGKTLRTGTSRYVVFGVPARNSAGESNTIVVTGLSPEGPGAYDVFLTATVARVERSSSGQAQDAGEAMEHWEFATASGERLEVRLAYRRAAPVKSHVEARIRSAKRPEFTRTYKIDQAADVVRGAASADRVSALTFRASGPSLAGLFDGTERLLSVTSIPWYVREVSVP